MISVVTGVAAAAGCQLVASSDIVVATPQSRYHQEGERGRSEGTIMILFSISVSGGGGVSNKQHSSPKTSIFYDFP